MVLKSGLSAYSVKERVEREENYDTYNKIIGHVIGGGGRKRCERG